MSELSLDPIAPGGWLGLLGGGQLGRMFCHAAQSLGYKVAVLDPAADGPAAMVADRHIQAAYDDAAGLAALAGLCPAVTTEFENVPAESLRAGSRPFLDYALVNTAPVSENLRERYAAEGAETIAADTEKIEAMGIRCITGAFAAEGDVLRHDADLVAKTVLRLALDERAAQSGDGY